MTTKKPVEVVVEKPKASPPVDPSLCQCTDVPRRWDTDGLIEEGGERFYKCSACGKKYK